jgi:hypothetical protein
MVCLFSARHSFEFPSLLQSVLKHVFIFSGDKIPVRNCEVNLATKQRFYLSPALTKYPSVAALDKHVWDSQSTAQDDTNKGRAADAFIGIDKVVASVDEMDRRFPSAALIFHKATGVGGGAGAGGGGGGGGEALDVSVTMQTFFSRVAAGRGPSGGTKYRMAKMVRGPGHCFTGRSAAQDLKVEYAEKRSRGGRAYVYPLQPFDNLHAPMSAVGNADAGADGVMRTMAPTPRGVRAATGANIVLNFLTTAVLRARTGNASMGIDVGFAPLPYQKAANNMDMLTMLIKFLSQLLMGGSIVLLLPGMMVTIVQEKELRLKSTMKMQGLSTSLYWMVTTIWTLAFHWCTYAWLAIFCAILAVAVEGGSLFGQSDLILTLILMTVWTMAQMAFGFAWSTLYSK